MLNFDHKGVLELRIMEMLNRDQARAAAFSRTHSLIIAGAGTGKTSTLISKTAAIVTEGGADPSKIALLTFSKKAAFEMRERLEKRLPGGVGEMFIGTYHSFCYWAMHKHEKILFQYFGYNQFPSLLTREQALKINDAFFEQHGHLLYGIPYNLIPQLSRKISADIKYRKKIEELTCFETVSTILKYPVFFGEGKRAIEAFEFDDLIDWCNRLYLLDSDFNEWMSKCFDYLLVDEFQDTSVRNCTMIKNLLEGGAVLCAVGDDYQSIYGFRQASPEIMMQFGKHFGQVDRFFLTVNYRSHKEIVAVSNRLIRKNRRQIHKRMVSHRGSGGCVKLYSVSSFDQECELIRALLNKNSGYSSCALLFRNNAYGAKLKKNLIDDIEEDRCLFSTFHSSKGLEYDHVILCGLHNSQVPSPLSNIAEERRLFYVALTRASHRLDIISYSEESRPQFIDELKLSWSGSSLSKIS